jgi:hypothetical protein
MKGNFGFEAGSDIKVKSGEGKNMFIKYNIPGCVDSLCR